MTGFSKKFSEVVVFTRLRSLPKKRNNLRSGRVDVLIPEGARPDSTPETGTGAETYSGSAGETQKGVQSIAGKFQRLPAGNK